MRYMNTYNTATLEPISEHDFGDIKSLCGAPWEAYHRSDLHSELLRLALLEDGQKTRVEVHRGVKITHIDADNASIKLEDGSQYEGDFLIGADGLHSDVRAAAIKSHVPPVDSNWNIYRFLLPVEEILEDEALKAMKLEDSRLMYLWGDPSTGLKRFVWYECRK